jgi:hypothetical protein
VICPHEQLPTAWWLRSSGHQYVVQTMTTVPDRLRDEWVVKWKADYGYDGWGWAGAAPSRYGT